MTMTSTLYDASHPYDWDAIEDQIESRLAQRISEKEEYLLYLLQTLIADAQAGISPQERVDLFTESFTGCFDSWEPFWNYTLYSATLITDPALLGISIRSWFEDPVNRIANGSLGNKEGTIWKAYKHLLKQTPFTHWTALASIYKTAAKDRPYSPSKLNLPNPLA